MKSEAPYPRRTATDDGFQNNWRSAKRSNPGLSIASSQPNEGQFRIHRTPARGASSSPAAPRTATPVRFDSFSDESGNEAAATKKGSYEMQGDAVEI